MNAIAAPLGDSLFRTGSLLLGVSLLLFCAPSLMHKEAGSYMAFFFIHYLLAAAYAINLIAQRRNRNPIYKRQQTFLLLSLCLVSAYALNRELVVFAASPAWFCAALFLSCAAPILSVYILRLSPVWRFVLLFILGFAAVLFLYLSLYLVPMYFFSLIALPGLALSIHTFIPVLFLFQIIFLISNLPAAAKNKIAFWSGVSATVLVVAGFTVVWKKELTTINRAHTAALVAGNTDLPAWMEIAKQIDDGAITEKILKTDLVYLTPDWNENFLWNVPDRSFGEAQQVHDPLVVLASFFNGPFAINKEDRIAILKSQFASRHQTEERLWTGKDLRTQQVISTVQLWPESRLSYTEKIVTVFNHGYSRWGGRQEEAIYTFHLPEGGVVTSLSLWMAGQEEKGVLTTKEKADSAYKTIVGVESRDPSVVHWKEGNHVSVRVFPVLTNEARIFKIGVTAPLRRCAGELFYDNIYFEGPAAENADETVKLTVSKTVQPGPKNTAFSTDDGRTFTRNGTYRKEWRFTLPDKAITPQVFNFNGHNYTLKPYTPQAAPAVLNDVYLDINSAWRSSEFESVWQSVQGKAVWAFDESLIRVTDANRHGLFKKLAAQRFSLFPVFMIAQPETAILVSKSASATPNLSDLDGSPFLAKLKGHEVSKKLRLFHIGDQPSPYLASLKEFRFFIYEHGDLKKLTQHLQARTFALDVETENEVVLHNAGIILTREPGTAASTAPDHLMRLFVYNHIMQQAGPQALSRFPEDSELVQLAKEAYVVSPVSSLVVLETQADYERFDITDSRQSLKNASANAQGAVPEPHEWLLIIIGAAVALYLFFKSRF